MWDKLNFFSWSKKKPDVQPLQREVLVTLTNGDQRETIHRSPSGTKMASSSSTKHGLDDDNSSEASTSLNFGFKTGSSPRRNSSYTFSRDPLDMATWSNVTSPGFTSRLVQQASGNSPLKEFNDSLSHSPFRKSPYRELGLGELPFVNYTRRSSPPIFPSPQKAPSLRSGVSSSVYNRDRRRNARQGQTFVRIAAIDPSMKANVSISRKSSSPPVGMGSNGGGPYPPRGSPRAGSEPYRAEGLGGIPQQELAMRFTRLWPATPGGPVPGPGRPSSPTSPSNIMEALTVGRKRTREQDTYYPPNATPPSVSPPSKISIGIGETPVRPQVPKRVKFGGMEGHDRPMMGCYTGMGAGDNEPLSSESILEQMNQTEKRFLPDSTSTPYSMQKKTIRMCSEDQPSALHSALRKRRSQTSVMSAVEDEARGEKAGRFCTCNECYAEAAGISLTSQNQSFRKDSSMSPRASDEKSTNTGDSRSKETCDIGVSTVEFDRGAFFREIFRKADKKKPVKNEEIDELMPYGKTVITKEMYERDKRKRIERYYRILKMKPPGGSIFDPNPANSSSPIQPSTQASALNSNIINDGTISSPSSILGTGAGASAHTSNNGFNFGSPPASSTSGGFSFGKQTSPIAPTITTSACSTITSPSSTGSLFNSSTAPTISTSATFGAGGPSPTLSTTVTPSPGIPTFGSPSAPGQISFSSGTDTQSKPKPLGGTTVESSGNGSLSTTTNLGGTGGFSFAPSSTSSTVTTSSTPAFGIGASAGIPTSVSSNSDTVPAFGGFGSPITSAATLFGAKTETTTTASTGDNNVANTTATGGSSSTGVGFSFGKPIDASGASNNSITGANTGTLQTSFSFGGSNNNQSTGSASVPPLFAQPSSGGSSDAVDNKSGTVQSNAGANAGGFNFSVAPKTTAPTLTTTSASGFGGNASTAVVNLTIPTVPSTSSTKPETNASSFGATSTIFGQTAPPSTTTASASFGSTFGSSGTGATTTGSGFSFGGNAGSSSGFSFSGGTNPATTVSSLATSPPSAFGGSAGTSAFGSGISSTKEGTAGSSNPSTFAAGGTIFGQTATPSTTSNSFGSTFGSSGTGATTTGSGFSFGGNSGSSGGFSFSGAANPATTVSSLATSPPSAFGGNATTTGFGSTASTTKTGTEASSNPPPFGATGALFGQTATPTTTAPTGSFGSTFGSSGTTAANPGFSFGGNTGSSGGFNFSGTATPAATTSSSLATSPTSGFGGGVQAAVFSPPPAFGSITSTTTGPAPSSNPTTFGSSGNIFGQSAAPTTTASSGSFGTAFGSSGSAPANPGFSFGGGNAPPAQGTPASAPFQFGQQAAQGVPGGFNFAATAPAPSPGGQPMFSMGSASTAPRRRDPRRRYR